MNRYAALFVSVACLGQCFPQAARAGDTDLDRFYLSVVGGYNNLSEGDISGGADGTVSFENGWAGYATIGYRVSDHVRAALELGTATAKLDSEELTGIGHIDLAGDVETQTGLIKIGLDMNAQGFSPFLAFGAGVANFSIDLDSPVSGTDSDIVPALLAEVGVRAPLSDSVDLLASGRYLWLDDVTLDPTNTGKNEVSGLSNFSAVIGLEFHP